MGLGTNLVNWWKCDDASAPLVDAVGGVSLYEVAGGDTEFAYSVAGKHGTAVKSLSGTWANSEYETVFRTATSFAVAGWFRFDDLQSATGECQLLRLRNVSDSQNFGLKIVKTIPSGTPVMTLTVLNASLTAVVANTLAVWHHVALSYTGGNVTLWLDGTSVGTAAYTLPTPSLGIYFNRTEFGGVGTWNSMDVSFDEWGYWSRALTSDDIAALAAGDSGSWFDFRGLKAHQLAAEVAYSANSSSGLTGLMAHQMAVEVAYSANGSLSGLVAHQMAAEVGYSPNGEVSGLIAFQLAAEVAYNPTRLYATGQPTTATWDVEAASPSPVLAATTATWDVETVIVPTINTPTEASWSVDAAVPPISGSSTTAAWSVDAAYLGASGNPTTATWSVDAAVPPISGSSTTATWDVDRVLSNAIEAQSTTATWSVDAVVPPIGSTTPAAAAWSVDKVWFREAPEFKYVFLTNILCQLGKTLRFKEETDNEITAAIKDEHGHDLDSSDFDFVLLTLYDNASQTLLRPSEVVSGSLLTIDEGDLLWRLLPRDTDIINDALRPPTPEKHTALIEFAHGTERTDDLTDPFATSAASNVITVTHPSHDLALRDHVWFVATDTVGGLTLTGLFLVTNVIDADSYQVVAHRVATGTATGGGSVTAYRLGYSNKAEIVYEAAKSDVL